MAISFIDKWLIAEGSDSDRWYVVHTQFPRFIMEMQDSDECGYESGHCEIFDECLDASLLAKLAREAGEVFAEYDRKSDDDED